MSDKKETSQQFDAASGAPMLPRSLFFRVKTAPTDALPSPRVSRNELIRRLSRFELFAGLPPGALKDVAAGVTVRACRRGEFLWQRGDVAKQVVLIDSGFVKAACRDREGASKTYGLFGPNDSLGIFALYAGMRYPTDAVALNEGLRLFVIEAAELTCLADKHLKLAGNLQGELARFTQVFIDKIEIISAGTVPQRLATLMMQLVNRYGEVNRDGRQALVPIYLTLEQISEIIGARVETIARAFAHWKRIGWLSTDTYGYHFKHLEKVRELLPD